MAILDEAPDAQPVAVVWREVEDWLGVGLPDDYKALVAAYGPLDVGSYVWVHGPCRQAEQDGYDYTAWLRQTHRDVLLNSRSQTGGEPPPLHPDPGGLLAWGYTRGGSYLLWDTGASTEPNEWPVVVFDLDAARTGGLPWQRYPMNTLGFLAEVILRGIPLPKPGRRMGPLPAHARRPLWLQDALPWVRPEPDPEVSPERRRALAEGTGLAALQLLVPPPTAPFLGDRTWDALFDDLGVRLPAEYVELMNTYGAGTWRNWLRTFAPLTSTFVGRITGILDGYQDLRAAHPGAFPIALWPEPGGFLPFGDSIDGDHIGWLTEGSPDNWPLFIESRHGSSGPLPSGLITTLLEWVRGRVDYPALAALDPRDDPLQFATFKPELAVGGQL